MLKVTTSDANRKGWSGAKLLESPACRLLEAENRSLEQHIGRSGGAGDGGSMTLMLSMYTFEGEGRESLAARLEAARDRNAELKKEQATLKRGGGGGGRNERGSASSSSANIPQLQREVRIFASCLILQRTVLNAAQQHILSVFFL